MGRTSISAMEKAYDKQLEEEYAKRLKGKVAKPSPAELKEKIRRFLDNHRICTLATCSASGMPRSTPLRYRSRDFVIYVFTEGGGKVQNILENPNVSVSVMGNYAGFDSVVGLQMWGKARIIKPESRRAYEQAKSIINMESRSDLKKIDLEGLKPMDVIKIKVKRARYLNFPEGILNQAVTIQ